MHQVEAPWLASGRAENVSGPPSLRMYTWSGEAVGG